MFYENQLGIKNSVVSLFTCFCPNTGTKFRESYHSNHAIPHRDDIENYYLSFANLFYFRHFMLHNDLFRTPFGVFRGAALVNLEF